MLGQNSRIRFRCLLGLLGTLCLGGSIRAQDLDQLIAELLEANPSIVAARRAVDSKRALVPSARTLPDPTVSLETMGDPLPLKVQRGDPSSARSLRFTQEIPYPGKLDLRGQIAQAEADEAWWGYERLRRELVAELRTAYYELRLARKTTGLVEKTRDHLQQFSEISAARYAVGQGAQQDVLKAQVEVSRLLDRLVVLRREEAALQARITTLLFRPPGSRLGELQDLPRPQLPGTLEQLYEKAAASNPEVRMGRKAVDRMNLEVSLARKSFLPDFEVGVSYFNRPGMPEMYGFMVGAKIPLFYWRKQRPEMESATMNLLAERRRYDATLSGLYFRVEDAYLKAQSDAELLELYGEGIIPQALLALESSTSSYRVGDVDFLTLLSNLTTVLDYEVKYQEVLTDYHKTLAVLESLTGEYLAR